ncbi:uncharacterized protein RCC_09572 [Ramularia collo-cygni]|uniref:Asparaginase n=1 Tax=Ramularia collo-cygni TaxID=112498 RepID=A0A2D3V0L1_9PEZI|nr:uncharacterized protein RCC_09572 [Ramularia collo-cygni]CZT23857.1 uncharacterized protein RCC_09572 [Ramularia collo-cygni]
MDTASVQEAPISIILHAGAGESYREGAESIPDFLRTLAADASERLSAGTSALDVVVHVTAALEDHPQFNAGKGASLNIEGEHERYKLEAAVIDGATGEYRGVLGVRRTRNPVRLAHALLKNEKIVMVSGAGTDDLAASHGLEMVDNSYFTVPDKRTYWANNVHRHGSIKIERHGTVGAVAMDKKGNLAAANSTGGTMFKIVGRIGDTAISGAGIYADSDIAIVCSGSGEAILKSRVASRIADGFHHGVDLQTAMKSALMASADHDINSSCGVIALTRGGNMISLCNARTFAVAKAQSTSYAEACIMQNSFTHLRQLTFLEDAECTVGYAKYPTMDGQAILKLHGGRQLTGLDRDIFKSVWNTLERSVDALMEFHGKTCCSCTTSQEGIQIFPHSSLSLLEKKTPQHILFLDHGESRSDQAWQYILSETQKIACDAQLPVGTLQIQIDFLGMERVHLGVSIQEKTPSLFPKCAEYQSSYLGCPSTEAGPRAINLPALKEGAKMLAEILGSS